jgi:uncharacterized GH25 family protein
MRRASRFVVTAFVVGALAAAALAHDFWIDAARHRFAKGDTVPLPLRFGESYPGEPAPRDDLRIEKFVVIGPDGEAAVKGEDRKDPAGSVTLDKEGVYVVAYRSKRRSIELEAAKFEAYLREEGLEHVAKLREERKETDKKGREVYSRCAKALLRAGDAASEGFDRVAKLRCEIVPETNPFAAAPGDALVFKVLFDEKPLEHGLVVARSKAEPDHTVAARTDAAGRVKLTLDRAGVWMVKCTHMVAAPAETGMDWESLWASLTFDVVKPAAPTEPR